MGGTKRAGDELCLPCQLPAEKEHLVDGLLERWRAALGRKVGQISVLEPEQQLIKEVREILDCDLCGDDQKTLRWIVTGGEGEAAAFEQDLVVTRISSHAQRLHGFLARHHRASVQLGQSLPAARDATLRDLEEIRAGLHGVRSAVHGLLLRAKEGSDKDSVRSLGRSLNDIHALLRRLDVDKSEVTRNSRLATLLITVCRRVLPVREIEPLDLRGIPPSHAGFLKVLDFYFFTDANKYCFGENFSGPNWFTRLKGNVAILLVNGSETGTAYNQFAVSGRHHKPGAPLVSEDCVFESFEAEDERGRLFDRRNDAEIKLLSAFADNFGSDFAGSGTLWSLKPLCKSCASVVSQFRQCFPAIRLEVLEDVH